MLDFKRWFPWLPIRRLTSLQKLLPLATKQFSRARPCTFQPWMHMKATIFDHQKQIRDAPNTDSAPVANHGFPQWSVALIYAISAEEVRTMSCSGWTKSISHLRNLVFAEDSNHSVVWRRILSIHSTPTSICLSRLEQICSAVIDSLQIQQGK